MKGFLKIIFFFILCLLVLPLVQARYHPIHLNPLNGEFKVTPRPVFTWSSWLKNDYQEQLRKYIEDSVGFKAGLTRIYNEYDYNLFSIPHSGLVVMGKNHNFFGEHYIRANLGDYFIGKNYIEAKVWQMKRLQDILWEREKILLVLLFAPDKGSFYPEDWPERFTKMPVTGPSNYSYYVQKCAEYGVNFIDYSNYFRLMRDTASYILIPRSGTHWSYYGMYLAADTMMRFLESKMKIRLPELVLDSIQLSDNLRFHDDEILNSMNLAWTRKYEKMGYPCFHFVRDSSCARPAALFIGDSFYWHWYENGIIQNLFSNTEFWYYFKDIYPESFTAPATTENIDLKKAIERQDIIFIIQVNGGAGKMGYEFVDQAYNLYDTSQVNPFLQIEKRIRNSPEWLETVREKAGKLGVPLDEMIRKDAIFLVNQDLLKYSKYKN